MNEPQIEQIGNITLDYKHYCGTDLYSDGEIEDEFLAIAKDRSPVEFQKIIEESHSWPIMYHFSTQRENIVEWLPMTKSDKILEVGSGCGAITGCLSKKAGQVECVDLSKKRSMVNAYRHTDCNNVTIHVGNFKDIEPELSNDFDYILLIGVFEYAQGYMGSDTPYEDFLNILKKHLKPNGRLAIAIENRMGLKYLAGCREDHLGTYFSGLEDYPEGGGVRTFSRQGMEQIFANCGVTNYHFYYPYPDYKFMNKIYSDSYLPKAGELYDNMRNYDRDRLVLFDEKNAFDSILRDKTFGEFSNSFFIVLGDAFPVKFSKYSNDRALPYSIKTEVHQLNDSFVVRKYPMNKEAVSHIRNMKVSEEKLKQRYEGSTLCINTCHLFDDPYYEVYAEFEYLHGDSLTDLLDQALKQNKMDQFLTLFKKYKDAIDYNNGISISDLDLVFSNILIQKDTWSIIDYEWTSDELISSSELAFRSIYCYLLENPWRNRVDLDSVLKLLDISDDSAEELRQKELAFQHQVTGNHKSMSDLLILMGQHADHLPSIMEKVAKERRLSSDLVQIYTDNGMGYSEENSYIAPNPYIEKNKMHLELMIDGNAHHVRIDPAMACCIVRISSMSFNQVPVTLPDRKVISCNGTLKGNSMIFTTNDPNICIDILSLDRKAENTLLVDMEVIQISSEIAEELGKKHGLFN